MKKLLVLLFITAVKLRDFSLTLESSIFWYLFFTLLNTRGFVRYQQDVKISLQREFWRDDAFLKLNWYFINFWELNFKECSECLISKLPKSKLCQNLTTREFSFQTTFWSFKPNASCLDAIYVLVPVRCCNLEFRFQTLHQNLNVWKPNTT